MAVNSWLKVLSEKAKELGSIDKIIRYHHGYYANASKTIKKFDEAGLCERRRMAEAMCTRILKYASRTHYGRPLDPKLEHWPILEKALLRNNPKNFLARTFPVIPASTGGTTGQPLRLFRSIECVAAEQAFIDSILLKYGASFRASRIAVLRADEVKDLEDKDPPYGVYRSNKRRLVLSNPHLSRYTIDWYIRTINEFQPEVLWAYPSMLANMIRLMEDAGLTLNVPIVLTSSESLSPELFQIVGRVLSAKVIDYYGQGERVCFAVSYQPNEYWFLPAYGRVELVPVDDSDVGGTTKSVKIVATAYWNKAMPLVRYDTGDLAIIPSNATRDDLDAIELGVKPFLGVAGRSNEYVVTGEGKSIGGLNHLPREVDHIFRLQVVQECFEMVNIKVLAQSGFSDVDYKQLSNNAHSLIPPEIKICIEVVEQLEKAANGKTPFVIRRLPDKTV